MQAELPDAAEWEQRLARLRLARQHGLRNLPDVLEQLLAEARRLTRAEAGTLYTVDGDALRFTVVQNDPLTRRLGEDEVRRRLRAIPLPLTQKSLAGYVALTGRTVNVHDVDRLSPDRPYVFNRDLDVRTGYRTRSVLALPIRDDERRVLGVIQLINALGPKGAPGPFNTDLVPFVRTLAAEAAEVIAELRLQILQLTLPAVPAAGAAPAVVEPDAQRPGPGPAVGRRLGDLLVAERLISPEQLAQAVAEQKRTNQRLGSILVRFGFITEAHLTQVLSRQYGFETVSLEGLTIAPEVIKLVPIDTAKRHSVIPVRREEHALTVAVADPTDLSVLDDIAFLTGLQVAPVLASTTAIRHAIEQFYDPPLTALDVLSEMQGDAAELEVVDRREVVTASQSEELRTSADDPPVVRLVNTILLDALRRGASDIHLECYASSFRVRFRVDGFLEQVMTPPKRLHPAVVSRIKIMADLDIAERRLPQDGRIKIRHAGREVDLRVSILPTIFGESVDLRILDGAVVQPDLSRLGFDARGLDAFLSAIRNPHGIVLITGPTGSGKTTTLYSAISTLNRHHLKILTIEDPVEYALEGVNQVHVNEEIGRTFAASLRSFLRHDPDVILVGEMRDLETAQIAVRASLTGHLVLSTLHTNDCASTIARLADMGVAPFLLSASLRLLMAQRLVRRVCPDCREPHEADLASLAQYGYTGEATGTRTLYRGRGCTACGFTGMRGRVGIFEVMPITPELADLVLHSAPAGEIRETARRQGMATLREAGLARVLEGLTTVEEVVRITSV
jgi:type IV pilus assembly protein PilB